MGTQIPARLPSPSHASMGPRSDNRGYGGRDRRLLTTIKLQWVHGRITVVMLIAGAWSYFSSVKLQWVHGRITVVMDNHFAVCARIGLRLQWVHGRITVVMLAGVPIEIGKSKASMGPRSDNRGYVPSNGKPAGHILRLLQWVHGRITVVMTIARSWGRPCLSLQWVHGRITVVMSGPLRSPGKD